VVSITVASIILLLISFIMGVRKNSNTNQEHDKKLFKQPPMLEDCPICFIPLPLQLGRTYMPCCGKVICNGCVYSPLYDNKGKKVDNKKCAFCRTPHPKTNDEMMKRMKKRIEAGDAEAMFNFGNYYRQGLYDFPQDYTKALELFHRAAELGFTAAYCNIGYAYKKGKGVEIDEKKANHYYELAAIGGDSYARYNLGNGELEAGNIDRAVKHFMIAVRSGQNESLDEIKELYTSGHATKEEYAKALQLYQTYLDDIKSKQRDEAAAAKERYRYY